MIMVFWINAKDKPARRPFSNEQLAEVLRFTESLRAQGFRHVVISSELAESIGKPGVQEVRDGKLPDGSPYEWRKRR